MTEPVRMLLKQLMKERGETQRSLSLLLGRDSTYLYQFLERGTPKRLGEEDRRTLAIFFDIDERELGARDPYTPS